MPPLLLFVALAGPSQPPATHDAANPLYKDLRESGVAVGPEARAKLPAPVLADGLDVAAQKKAITGFLGGDYSWDEFTRSSVVAPSLLRIAPVNPSDPQAPARLMDVGFVVYGDFKKTDDDKFLDRLLNGGREGGTGKALTPENLAERKIVAGKQEKFGLVEFDILDRVRLKATGRAVWTRTGESVLAAAEIDPRFRGDAEFPNEWRPLTKEGGKLAAGRPHPYGGAALYLKVTKLADPPGAMFAEQHVIFVEPTGWFDGANLLRSKLPPVVQNNVRTMRREWLKGVREVTPAAPALPRTCH